jgi:y4mF family transcriptional regulator
LGIIVFNLFILYPLGYKMNRLSELVKLTRKQHGMTQHDLALKSGLGLRLIWEIEQGKTTMRMDKVNQLLALFGMELVPASKTYHNE